MILDTCALLWLASGEKRFSRAALEAIRNESVVHVSAISGFEVGLKVAKGKLRLPLPPSEWFSRIVAHHNLSILPLNLATCLEAAALPPIHNDPCDRFIVAAAKLNNLPVVTADSHFAEYGIKVVL